MKTVSYRGGVLRFRIPSSWREEYDEHAGGAFYEDAPDSGTLRVTVITLEPPSDVDPSATAILESLSAKVGKTRDDIVSVGANAYVRFEEIAVERGTALKIFYWLFANPVPPRDARVVTFSYTVLEALAQSEQVTRDLAMLDQELAKTEFAARIGVLRS